jgi:hypothetical protein
MHMQEFKCHPRQKSRIAQRQQTPEVSAAVRKQSQHSLLAGADSTHASQKAQTSPILPVF